LVEEESNDRNDSAFHEPEYSNPASFESSRGSSEQENDYQNHMMARKEAAGSEDDDEDYVPDYEEVDPLQVQALRRALQKKSFLHDSNYVYNMASDGVMTSNRLNRSVEAADPSTQERIMQSLIYCIHKEAGCPWSGPLHGLKGHLNVCQKDALDCLNKCGARIARTLMEDHMLYTCSNRLVSCSHCKKDFTGGILEDHKGHCGFEPVDCENKCGQKVQRNRLKAHQINTCSKRLVGCAYCARNFTADTLQSHHTKCALFPVPCPFRCTVDSLNREDVEEHLAKSCPLANAKDCVYKEAGCRFRGSNNIMTGHMDEAKQVHLDLMCSLAHKQQSLIKKLNDQLEKSNTTYNGVLVWKIKDFAARMKEAKTQDGLELVSAPFYTSQYGYRVQASLFLNGNGGGEDSNISVYIKLLPGEYDSILKWPFKHTVSFTLLDQADQRKDACNIVESFLPDPTWKNFQRPSREPDQLGFGFPKFVPHQMLFTRQYIRDDCLFIKIRVDPSRNVAV
jgi:TNF receptor-associated factor 4